MLLFAWQKDFIDKKIENYSPIINLKVPSEHQISDMTNHYSLLILRTSVTSGLWILRNISPK